VRAKKGIAHIRNKPRREALAPRFRNPADPLRIVIVRDMWLTGIDAPSLPTMYVDKPMRGRGLMQAIAHASPTCPTRKSGTLSRLPPPAQRLVDQHHRGIEVDLDARERILGL
jgi:type I site-specific restriction-modification system R (restriction) subunit